MKANGLINIGQGVKMNNPEIDLKRSMVTYEWGSNTVVLSIYIHGKIANQPFSTMREHSFINGGGEQLTKSDVLIKLAESPFFSQFK